MADGFKSRGFTVVSRLRKDAALWSLPEPTKPGEKRGPGRPPIYGKERISLAREEFLHALRRAEIMTSEKSNSVKMTFGKNNLAITANSPEVGEARESIAINYKGKEMAIAFNPKYMIDPLNALANDEVFIELIDELSPGVLKINGPFLYVVMPMRLS